MAMTHDPDEEASNTGDSAMDTGSDAGGPGEHLAELALTPDELALLAQLQQPADDVVLPVEESPAASAAAEDDSPLSVAGPPDETSDDPLDVHFTNPADRRSP
jgi:hypothetical protein